MPDGMQSRGVRELTTVPTQALMLMNNQFVRDQASHFANRIRKAVGNDNLKHIVEEAYWLALSRSPTNEELSSSVELLSTEGQSLENFCHILFTLNEFCYVD